jgi:hypothetical protein
MMPVYGIVTVCAAVAGLGPQGFRARMLRS